MKISNLKAASATLACLAAATTTPCQGGERYRIALTACWENTGFFKHDGHERPFFGVKAQAAFTPSWFGFLAACGSSRKSEADIDLGEFDEVNSSNAGGISTKLGMGRMLWQFLSLETGLSFLEDSSSHLLLKFDDDDRLEESKTIEANRSLLGIGANVGLSFLTNGGVRYFTDVGLARYFYDFNQAKDINYLYKTSHVGISFGF